MNLEEIRQEIDQVDRDLVLLLEKRMDLVSQVVDYKAKSGKPILDKDREAAVLDKIAALVTKEDYKDTLLATFADIMKESRAYQAQKLS